MDLVLPIAGAGALGIILGLLYFGLLRWTVMRMPHSHRPVRLLIGGFVARAGLVAPAFVLLAMWRWELLAVALTGFVIARMVLVRRGLPPVGPPQRKHEN